MQGSVFRFLFGAVFWGLGEVTPNPKPKTLNRKPPTPNPQTPKPYPSSAASKTTMASVAIFCITSQQGRSGRAFWNYAYTSGCCPLMLTALTRDYRPAPSDNPLKGLVVEPYYGKTKRALTNKGYERCVVRDAGWFKWWHAMVRVLGLGFGVWGLGFRV